MKYIKLFENYSSIDNYLKESTFDNLPLDFKKGIMTWMVEGDVVEWTYEGEIDDWVNGENVIQMIGDYSREKGEQKFLYGFVPVNLIIEKITEWIDSEGDYENFEEWRAAYQSTNDADHGNSLFPIIVDDDNEEYIDDGWHRFNYYLSKGIKNIPVIKFV
jgi:hypothetical protein